jgi:hypothetical protein
MKDINGGMEKGKREKGEKGKKGKSERGKGGKRERGREGEKGKVLLKIKFNNIAAE